MNKAEFKTKLGKVQTEVFNLRMAVGCNEIVDMDGGESDEVFQKLTEIVLNCMEIVQAC